MIRHASAQWILAGSGRYKRADDESVTRAADKALRIEHGEQLRIVGKRIDQPRFLPTSGVQDGVKRRSHAVGLAC